MPEGVWAANLLGLSPQVPAKITYLTDGPNSEVPIGRRTIYFKHARPSSIAGREGKLALVIQALRHLGKKGAPRRRHHLPAPKIRSISPFPRGTQGLYSANTELLVNAQHAPRSSRDGR